MESPSLPDPYRFGERIEQVIAYHARRTPHAPAVQQGEQILTYEELVTGATRVAASLHRRGVAAGDVVPVFLERSCELVVAVVGVLRAGAAYIAMDVRWPYERIADVVNRSGARLVVTAGNSAPLAGVEAVSYASLSTGTADLVPPAHTDGTAAACVFYTSGSTGRPKGVLSPHRGTIRTLVECTAIPVDAASVFLQAAPLPWDGFALELWAPLLNGGRCVLMDRHLTALEPDGLRCAIDRGVNSLWLTSSLFNLLSDEVPDLFSAVRLLLVGGERVSPAHVRRVLRRFPGMAVVNGYGPAESTIFTTAHPVREQDIGELSVEIPLGKPVPCTGVQLLDAECGKAEGRYGEIAVCGDGLALGYLADPEETARRFVLIDDVRYYRTGDLAEEDDEGNLRYRGRLDRQIKINGVRVEPGEVDAVLEAHPEVASAYALRVQPRPNQPLLAALYTTRHGRAVDAHALQEFASRRLISAMVPGVVCHLAELPLGATGKMDESAARRIALDAITRGRVPAGDRLATNTGDEMLDLVRHALVRPDLDPHEDFLLAGASSLDVLRLCARLESRLGIRVSMADVYQRRTVDELHHHTHGQTPSSTRPDDTQDDQLTAPLSYAQRRFWMAEQISPGAMDNVVQLAYLLTGPIRVAALENAVQDVADRHPVLRTIYPACGGVPCQQVLDADHRLTPEWVEAPGRTADLDPQLLARHLSDPWWHERFKLDAAPPVRIRIARIAPDRHLLFLHLHHIAFDGWSETVFLTDLAAAYAARLQGHVWTSTDPTFSYASHSRWEAESVEAWKATDLPYWRQQLADVPAPALPLAGPAGTAARRLETTIRVSAAHAEQLRQAADRHGGPRVAAFLTGVGQALNRTLGMDSAVIGTTSAGRFAVESQAAIGYFVNPVAVAMSQLHRPSARLIGPTVDRTLGALSHARTPFDLVVRDLNPPRGRHPFFQAWAVLQWPQQRLELGGAVRLQPIRLSPPTSAVELFVEALPTPTGSWDVVVHWREDGIDRSTAEKLAANLRNAFAEFPSAHS